MYHVNKNFLFLLLFISSVLFGALNDKSAIVYYGKKISYPMVGIHDYIIVQPNHIETSSHGFSIYKDKIYAYVSIGEMAKTVKEYSQIKEEWKIAKNDNWNSTVLDISNPKYHQFLFDKVIEPLLASGYKHFFFDTLDSYQIAASTQQERVIYEIELANFINKFHEKYPNAKLIINRGFEVIDKVHDSIEAVLFESYYSGIGPNNTYKNISSADRKWLDIHLN
ncbi:MAG: hypothetical protein DRG78_12035, partial [Epsilonproteobacteria bacterium]